MKVRMLKMGENPTEGEFLCQTPGSGFCRAAADRQLSEDDQTALCSLMDYHEIYKGEIDDAEWKSWDGDMESGIFIFSVSAGY